VGAAGISDNGATVVGGAAIGVVGTDVADGMEGGRDAGDAGCAGLVKTTTGVALLELLGAGVGVRPSGLILPSDEEQPPSIAATNEMTSPNAQSLARSTPTNTGADQLFRFPNHARRR
jgi:hypothetical protein